MNMHETVARYGIKVANTQELLTSIISNKSISLLSKYAGDISRIADLSIAELTNDGLTKTEALRLVAAFELARHFNNIKTSKIIKVSGPADVDTLLRPRIASLQMEVMYVIALDTKNKIICEYQTTVGLVDRTQVHPREIFREAIKANASRIILAHNHPSGNTTPSENDIASTRLLVEAGRIIGIEVVDHIIIGTNYTSLRELGLMPSKTV